MTHASFETLLKHSIQEAPQEWPALENTILLAQAQAQARWKHQRERIPFRRFLFMQVRYIGWQFWIAQGIFLLLFDRMLLQLYGELFWDSPTSVARLLFCVSTLVAMMALPLLYRSRKYRMQEVESAAYFSASRLLIAKLAAIGIGDILLLAGMFLMTIIRTSMDAGNLTFYLLLPFLVVSTAYLYMMGHCSGNGFLVGSLTLGASMILLSVGLPGRWIPLLQQSMNNGWCLLCLALLTFSAEQLRYLLRSCPYAELQIR